MVISSEWTKINMKNSEKFTGPLKGRLLAHDERGT
jgi:hypothetical protein